MSKLRMDPEFLSLIKQSREILRDASIVREVISAARKGVPSQLSGLDLVVEDLYVSSPDNEEQRIPVRLYRRRNMAGPLPMLLYLHGGGFFCGDLFSDELQCAQYALNVGCAVICVAYRLAPEEPFPAALMDCYQVLEFLWNKSRELNIHREFIAIGGSSAGANLAAAVALLARDRKGPKICFQMLLVPALDDRLDTDSSRQFTDVPDFGRREAAIMWRWYLGETPHEVPSYAAPARATDLSDLPPTYILCAGLDPLRDEGLDYANRLKEAEVAVELHLVPSIPHGFASVPSATISVRLLNEQIDVLRAVFSHKKM